MSTLPITSEGQMQTRILEAQMVRHKEHLMKMDELALAEHVFRHYVSLASLSMELLRLIKRGDGSKEIREIVAHRLGEMTQHFRNDFGTNPPWVITPPTP